MVGVTALVAGIVLQVVAAGIAGAAIIGLGVFLATRHALPAGETLTVGGNTFASRQELMSAIDRERARRDCDHQRAAVDLLERQLATLDAQTGPTGSGRVSVSALTDLTSRELDRLLEECDAEVQRLSLDLAGQRASLERGGRGVGEVAPLEERVLQLRQQVEHLDGFGSACRLAATSLASASEEIRRAYAPRLQAYLGRDLATVTDGRYTEALVSDAFEVLLRIPETRSMVDLRQLSRGTQQQVYLLLRLGLMEVMAGVETLPFFLDDALALADDDRRTELLRVLEAQEGQVVYFTAGEGEAAVAFGDRWHRVDLPRPLTGAGSSGAGEAGEDELKAIDRGA
jgi:DNA repair exonuclease SbcCD ATPase subunit